MSKEFDEIKEYIDRNYDSAHEDVYNGKYNDARKNFMSKFPFSEIENMKLDDFTQNSLFNPETFRESMTYSLDQNDGNKQKMYFPYYGNSDKSVLCIKKGNYYFDGKIVTRQDAEKKWNIFSKEIKKSILAIKDNNINYVKTLDDKTEKYVRTFYTLVGALASIYFPTSLLQLGHSYIKRLYDLIDPENDIKNNYFTALLKTTDYVKKQFPQKDIITISNLISQYFKDKEPFYDKFKNTNEKLLNKLKDYYNTTSKANVLNGNAKQYCDAIIFLCEYLNIYKLDKDNFFKLNDFIKDNKHKDELFKNFSTDNRFLRVFNKGYFSPAVKKLGEMLDFGDNFNNNDLAENILLQENVTNNKETIKKRQNVAQNKIYYGIPGCGKSYKVDEEYSKENGYQTERIVFYPDYSYADFVGQCMPVKDKKDSDKQSFDFVPGPFTRILKDAWKNPENNYALIIEEINRGNAAAIFGDLFQLLDREDKDKGNKKKGQSKYGITNKQILDYLKKADSENDNGYDYSNISKFDDANEKVYIPSNLSIIATMNTTDQNLFVLDSAFKRRWQMVRVANKFEKDGDMQYFNHLYIPFNNKLLWKDFAESVNSILKGNDNIFGTEDKQLGAWFAKETDCLVYKTIDNGDDTKINDVDKQKCFADKVIAYLFNDAVPQNNRNKVFKEEIKCLDDIYDRDKIKPLDKIFNEIILQTKSQNASLKNDNNSSASENSEV